MKLLITGTKGRLGAALAAAYASRHEVVCVGRSELDLSVPERIPPALGRLNFDLVRSISFSIAGAIIELSGLVVTGLLRRSAGIRTIGSELAFRTPKC